jgi:hypothetical protein
LFPNPSPEECCRQLREVRTIAVVGLSPKPDRPSHYVSKAMQQWGFRIVPVHPALDEALGERVYPSLSAIPVPLPPGRLDSGGGGIDLVDVFRAAEHIDAVVDECLRLGIPRLWIQEGIVNMPAAKRARAGGMFVVMDRCLMRDYRIHCRG